MVNRFKKNIDVVVAGHLCLDIAPIFRKERNADFSRIFVPGTLTNISGVNITAAGAVPNVGITLSLLGLKTHLIGKTGTDFFGKGIVKYLKEMNAEMSVKMKKGERTSYTMIIVPPGIDRIFFHDPGANDSFNADDINFDIVKQSRLFHFGYPPLMRRMYEEDGKELIRIFRKVKEMGVVTSLDMAFTEPSSDSGRADWTKILRKVLPYVDIFIPSIEETLYMIERDYFNELNRNLCNGESLNKNLDLKILPVLGNKLLSYGATIAAVKCGPKGLYVATGRASSFRNIEKKIQVDVENWAGRELLIESYDVPDIKSTTGAGDCCIAGFIAGFLKGMTIEDTARTANAVAARSLSSYDVFSNMVGLESVFKDIRKGMTALTLEINSPWWKFDRKSGTWRGKMDNSVQNRKPGNEYWIN